MICILLRKLLGKLIAKEISFPRPNLLGSIVFGGLRNEFFVGESHPKSMAGSVEDIPLADADQLQVMERPKGVARKE